MNVTPRINDGDNVTLNVRPTISRIPEFVDDPGVASIAANTGIAAAGAVNRVLVAQVRETETVPRAQSRRTAVFGGRMPDRRTRTGDGPPGQSDLDEGGGLFEARARESVETELAICMRPTVICSPSVGGDLRDCLVFLPNNLEQSAPLPTPPAPPGAP